MLDVFWDSYYLASVLARQYWNKDKLQKYQKKRLQSIIKYAYDYVAFYHYKFKKEGISPYNVRSLKDLSKIPIITKDDLRNNDSNCLVSSQYPPSSLRIQLTSGSTGKPFAIYLNKNEEHWRKAISLRANISCGQKLRDKWVLLRAPHHFSDISSFQRKLGLFSTTNIPVLTNLDYQISLLKKIVPDILDGYSGTLHLLAKEIEKRDTREINPRIVFGTAELISDRASRFIEEKLNTQYYDQFGCSEFDRTAWQCPEKVGYHIDSDSVITQFVDKEGNEVAPGERGELVYTSLFNYSMPFIRYAIGDLGILSDENCSCGRKLPLMKDIEGRKDSLIILPDGRNLSPRVLTSALSRFEYYLNIEQFKIIQEKTNLIKIYIEKRKDTLSSDKFIRAIRRHFRREFSFLFRDVEIDIKMQRIKPEKTGKRRAVISKLTC